MRKYNGSDGFVLLMLAIIPIILFFLFIKFLIKAVSGLCTLGVNSSRQIKQKIKNDSIIPSDEDIDRYEMYNAIFDDED